MNDPGDIFELIKSLSKSEKRYFKLNYRRQAGRNAAKYLQLFDMLDELDSYDEKSFIATLPDSALRKHYRQAKFYLGNAILRALNQYHERNDTRARMSSLLQSARILAAKGLHRMSYSVLERARNIAGRSQAPIFEMLIFVEQRDLLDYTRKNSEQYLQDVDRFSEQINLRAERTYIYSLYRGLYARLHAIHGVQGPPRSLEELAALEGVFTDPIMQSGMHRKSVQASFYFHEIRRHFFAAQGDADKAIQEALVLRKITRSDTRFGYLYGPIACNLCQHYIDIGLVAEFRQQAAEIQALMDAGDTPGDIGMTSQLRILLQVFHIQALTREGRFEECQPRVAEIAAPFGVHQAELTVNNLLFCYYYFFYAEFGCGNFDKAFRWLEKITLDKQHEIRSDIFFHAPIMSLIVHYELGNIDTLEYLLRSTYRMLNSKQRIYALERIVLDFIRQLTKLVDLAGLEALMRETRTTLLELESIPLEGDVLKRFDFIAWLDAKLARRSFAAMAALRFKEEQAALHTESGNQ